VDRNRLDAWWFAIQVRPRYEFVTARILRSKGYEEFVPTYHSLRQWSDRRKEIEVPLFTGYVFCKYDPRIQTPIVTTAGAIRIVGTSKGVSRIEGYEMQAIQTMVQSEMKAQPCPYLAVGDQLRIGRGPLSGLEGILKSQGNQCCLVLSVNLIQASISVEIDSSDIATVNGVAFAAWQQQHAVAHARRSPLSLSVVI
jgi:transcription antitermination factor NusG